MAIRRIAMAAAFLFVPSAGADAMNFTLRDRLTVHAVGPIEKGDAANFAALPKFNTLELESPGGLVNEALAIAANMDARGGIRTVVKPGADCASACAMALFVSGTTRIVYMGGRLGIHSCARGGIRAPECNTEMAANATAHGVPWGVIESFGNATKPSDMMWLNAEDAECWGLMKWSAQDESNNGIACFMQGLADLKHSAPNEITPQNANKADDIICRMNAGFSRIYVPTGREGQGFSDVYRRACERVAADPRTPKYAAIDIILWLSMTDPNVVAIKPGTLMIHILNSDNSQISNCWKCLTILAMSYGMHDDPKEALRFFQMAVAVVKHDHGSAPAWLMSRVELAAAGAAKQNR
jgi:hypothetical protein